MRTPLDYIIIGCVVAFLGVVPLGAGVVLGSEWAPIGFVAAVVVWSIGGFLVQIGLIGAGVQIGLRARADERKRENAQPLSRAPKVSAAGRVTAGKRRGPASS